MIDTPPSTTGAPAGNAATGVDLSSLGQAPAIPQGVAPADLSDSGVNPGAQQPGQTQGPTPPPDPSAQAAKSPGATLHAILQGVAYGLVGAAAGAGAKKYAGGAAGVEAGIGLTQQKRAQSEEELQKAQLQQQAKFQNAEHNMNVMKYNLDVHKSDTEDQVRMRDSQDKWNGFVRETVTGSPSSFQVNLTDDKHHPTDIMAAAKAHGLGPNDFQVVYHNGVGANDPDHALIISKDDLNRQIQPEVAASMNAADADLLKKYYPQTQGKAYDGMLLKDANSLHAGLVAQNERELARLKEGQASLPKTLEEATAKATQAHQNYLAAPTPENKKYWENAEEQKTNAQADKTKQAANQAAADSMARGDDYAKMVEIGVNPITKERLSLDNAPSSALVNPTTGDVIPTKELSTLRPTQQELNRSDFAKSSIERLGDVEKMIANGTAKYGAIDGPIDTWMAKHGMGDQYQQAFTNYVNLAQTAATAAHVGGRFNQYILQKAQMLINPNMNTSQLAGAMDSIKTAMSQYADAGWKPTVTEWKTFQAGQTPSPGGTVKRPETPDSHIFDSQAWLHSHPGGDVNAAKAYAASKGYQVK